MALETALAETAGIVDAIKGTFLESARAHCPTKTGGTRDSLSVETSATAEGSELKLMGSQIAAYIIGGTRAHTIVPNTASVLHWMGSGGNDMFAMSVNHPGTQPNDFRRPVVDELKPLLEAAGNSAMQAIIMNIRRSFA